MSSHSLIQSPSYVLLNGIQVKASPICLIPFRTASLNQIAEFKESVWVFGSISPGSPNTDAIFGADVFKVSKQRQSDLTLCSNTDLLFFKELQNGSMWR